MQQAQQRSNGTGAPVQAERISWARAMIFAVGFFFLGALLIGQLPSYIFDQMTASSLVGLEQGSLALAAICLAGFIVIQCVVMLFDTFVSAPGLAKAIDPQCPFAINPARGCPGPITGLFIVNTIFNIVLAIAVLCTLGAFTLRFHYLLRPVRKRTMSGLYLVGINLAQVAAVFLLVWLVVGTCLIIYLAAFAFFSIPGFRETNPNVPFVPGLALNNGSPGSPDAIIVFILMGLLAGIQFYFLVRNRYRV